METARAGGHPGRDELTERLVEAGHYVQTGVQGLYGHGGEFERILRALNDRVTSHANEAGAQELCFPPVVNRTILRSAGYMENFPDLVGSIHGFRGDDRAQLKLLDDVNAGDDWSPHLCATEMTLAPAGCYALYPTQRGTLPEGGRLVDLTAWVFRHEPSDDPARLQSFRMHENIRLGTPDEVFAWREQCRAWGLEWLGSLGLEVEMVVASDPFFGRGGKLMKAAQREQALKFEITTPITHESGPTAIASFNYHQEKFGTAFDILTADGRVAHTACLGFGLERIGIALLSLHGMDVAAWPEAIRGRLFGA